MVMILYWWWWWWWWWCNSLIDWGRILGLTMGQMFGNATINHPDVAHPKRHWQTWGLEPRNVEAAELLQSGNAKYDRMVDRKVPHLGGLILRMPGFFMLHKRGYQCFPGSYADHCQGQSFSTGTRPIQLGTLWAIYFQGGRVSLLRSMDSTLQIKL